MKENCCDIIQDLMPLQIDGVCSETSEQLIKGHLATCGVCTQVYEDMQSKTPEPVSLSNSDKTFGNAFRQMLRTIRLKNVLIGALIAVILFIAGGLAYDNLFLFSKQMVSPASVDCQLSQTEEGYVQVTLHTDVRYNASRYYEEEPGVLYIGIYRPVIMLPWKVSAQEDMIHYPGLRIKDGILYLRKTVDEEGTAHGTAWNDYAQEILEIRLGSPGNFRIVYRPGDSIVTCTPDQEEEWQRHEQLQNIYSSMW